MTTHELKTWPTGFEPTWSGAKTYDIRRYDRPFQPDDRVVLREWNPTIRDVNARYTGRAIVATITHVTEPNNWGLPEGMCVIGYRIERKLDGGSRDSQPRAA